MNRQKREQGAGSSLSAKAFHAAYPNGLVLLTRGIITQQRYSTHSILAHCDGFRRILAIVHLISSISATLVRAHCDLCEAKRVERDGSAFDCGAGLSVYSHLFNIGYTGNQIDIHIHIGNMIDTDRHRIDCQNTTYY